MMMFRTARVAMTALAITAFASQASAQAAGANCTAPINVYGGTGIPTANSMCMTVNGANLYLGISPRYSSPAPTTDGIGNWTAQTGDSQGGPTNAGFAMWNFNYAVVNASANDYYMMRITGLGVDPFLFQVGAVPVTPFFDSSNLKYFQALGFNNMDAKQYTFSLDAYAKTDVQGLQSLGHIEEVVNVISTVPEPSTYVLMASGLAALAFVSKRRNRKNLASFT